MSERDFELLVIGSGPAGQKAAVQAAKLGKRVACIERRHMVGGVCVNTGTIPSKTLREAVLYLTGMTQRDLYGQSYRVKEEITIDDLRVAELEEVRALLDQRHLRPERGEHRRVLDPDHPGAGHNHRPGHPL